MREGLRSSSLSNGGNVNAHTSPKKGVDTDISDDPDDKVVSCLASPNSGSAKVLAVSSLKKNGQVKLAESERLESSRDANASTEIDANANGGTAKQDKLKIGGSRRGRKRKSVEMPGKDSREADEEARVSSAVSSPEQNAEDKLVESELVECVRDDGAGPDHEQIVNSAVDIGADDGAEQGRCKFEKAKIVRKSKNLENPWKDSVKYSEEGRMSLSIYAPEQNVEEKQVESEHVECINDAGVALVAFVNSSVNTNANGDAKQAGPKFVEGRRGRKRKNLGSPEKDSSNADEVGKVSPMRLDGSDFGQASVVSPERQVEDGKGVESEQGAPDGNVVSLADANVDSGTPTDKHGIVKGKRGRKRKRAENFKCKEEVGAETRKFNEDSVNAKTQVVGRVLRSRTLLTVDEKGMDEGNSDGVIMGRIKKQTGPPNQNLKDKSTQITSKRRKKSKGRRGRPPKLAEKSVISAVLHDKEQKVMLSRRHECQLKSKNVVKGLISDLNEKSTTSKKNSDKPKAVDSSEGPEVVEGVLGLREQKQLVRDQIVSMLMKAGWTVEYRPRLTKEYSDAVYVSPDGKTHWSVTLAYRKLKERVDSGVADSKTISAFTPIAEELLRKLFRQTVQGAKKKGKLKKNENNLVKEVQEKKQSRKKLAAKNVSGAKRKQKLNKVKSPNKKKTKDTSTSQQANFTGSSHSKMPKSKHGERRSRKPCALLVRSSDKSKDPDSDGFTLYDGKRSLLSWMIDLGTIPLGGKVQYSNNRRTKGLLSGTITVDGIRCGCCDNILSILEFESHAGIKQCQPFKNIYLESGTSLLQCLADSWNKEEQTKHIGFRFVDVDGDDPNDDTCNICGDGGDLICCDGCPSTFHQSCLDIEKFPSGDWHCVYCSCKFCKVFSNFSSWTSDDSVAPAAELRVCHLCQEKFHQTCLTGKDAVSIDSNIFYFCGRICQELFQQLQMLLGVKHELEDGFSYTLLRHCDVSNDVSLDGASQKFECNSKLAVALSIMDECFLPIVDERSGINMIHNVVYSCGSNFSRLNYSGFFTAILERGDEIISAASIRIHGRRLAEMPFIGTRNMYRRQGMARRLLNGIELALCSLDVEKLVIPAVAELFETWTSAFGFAPLEKSKRQDMRQMSMIVFPGTDMLQKHLLKHRFSERNMITTSVTKSIHPCIEHQNQDELKNGSQVGSYAGANLCSRPAVFVQNDAAALDTAACHCDGPSHNVSETANGKIVAHENGPTFPSTPHGDGLLKNSNSLAFDTPELDQEQEFTGRSEHPNSKSGPITILPDAKAESSKLNLPGSWGVDHEGCIVSQIGCHATYFDEQLNHALDENKKPVDFGSELYCLNNHNLLNDNSECHSATAAVQLHLHSNGKSEFACEKCCDVLSEVENDIRNQKEKAVGVEAISHTNIGDSYPQEPRLSVKSFGLSESESLVNHSCVTLGDSKPFCNSGSCSGVTCPDNSSSCNACGVPEVQVHVDC